MKTIKGLKIFEKVILSTLMLLIIVALAGGLIWLSKPTPRDANAAVYYSQDIPGIQTMPFCFSRAVTTTGGLNIHTFYAPFKMRVLEFSGLARLLETTSADETYTLDIKEGNVSLLSGAIPLYQTTLGTGTLSDTSIAAGAKVDIVLTIAATSHLAGVSCTDLTSLLTYQRTN